MPLDLDEKNRLDIDLGMVGFAMPFIIVGVMLFSAATIGWLWPDYGYLAAMLFAGAGMLAGWLMYPNYSLEYGEVKDKYENLQVANHNLKEALLKGAQNYAKLQGAYEASQVKPVEEKAPPEIAMRKKKPELRKPVDEYPPEVPRENAVATPKKRKSGARK